MVEQKGKSSQATEITPELNPQEQFIVNLYGKTLDWLTNDQRGKVVAEFGPQEIRDWESYESDPGRTTRLSINLLKAVLVKTPERNFALVLGRRRRSKYDDEETLGLQFGLHPSSGSKRFEDLPLVDKLRSLTTSGGYGNGDFYQNSMTRGISINCWADSSIFGGQEVRRWEKDKLLTPSGINACLEIVQRTSQNAFIR